MFRRLASTVLLITVLSFSLTPAYGASDNKKQPQFEAKIKEAVLSIPPSTLPIYRALP